MESVVKKYRYKKSKRENHEDIIYNKQRLKKNKKDTDKKETQINRKRTREPKTKRIIESIKSKKSIKVMKREIGKEKNKKTKQKKKKKKKGNKLKIKI